MNAKELNKANKAYYALEKANNLVAALDEVKSLTNSECRLTYYDSYDGKNMSIEIPEYFLDDLLKGFKGLALQKQEQLSKDFEAL